MQQLFIFRRFMAEETDVDEMLSDSVALLTQNFAYLGQVEFALSQNGLTRLVDKVELDASLNLTLQIKYPSFYHLSCLAVPSQLLGEIGHFVLTYLA